MQNSRQVTSERNTPRCDPPNEPKKPPVKPPDKPRKSPIKEPPDPGDPPRHKRPPIGDPPGDRKSKDPVYAELTRHLGFEYGGMILHEYYFENLAAKSKAAPSEQQKRPSKTVLADSIGGRKHLLP